MKPQRTAVRQNGDCSLAVDGWAFDIWYIWYSEEGPERAAAPCNPLLAVPNVRVHPSAASVSK